jgi:hypothetical protein
MSSLVAVASLPVIWRERAKWRPEMRQLALIGLKNAVRRQDYFPEVRS